jgi:hypothetical protein
MWSIPYAPRWQRPFPTQDYLTSQWSVRYFIGMPNEEPPKTDVLMLSVFEGQR